MNRSRISRAALAAVSSCAVLVATSACGGDSGGEAGGKITLTVATFSDFGYKPLIAAYEKSHPNIDVKERVSQTEQHHNSLSTQLAAGSGAADVVAVEEGFLPKFRDVADKFADLNDYGAAKRKGDYLGWKWEQGVVDGKVIGYGTDVGGLAMCYRTDLFEQAGLPTDREEVAKLWPTWDDYFATGKEFQGKVEDKAWFDSVGNIFSAMMNQTTYGFFDQDDTYIADSNPKVKEFFTASATAAADGESAALSPFTQQWNAGIKQGRMATMPCPAWMNGLIAEAAGEEAKGKWDIADVPGDGGNWGGSFLTVPEQSEHAEEAAELASFLTSADSQKKIFTGPVGALSSITSVLEDPEVTGTKQEFFNDAPTGTIYGESAKDLKPNYRGTLDQQVRIPFGNALALVEQKKASVPEAWDKALADAGKAVKQ